MEYVYAMQLMAIKNLLIVMIVILSLIFAALVIGILRQETRKYNDFLDGSEDIQ